MFIISKFSFVSCLRNLQFNAYLQFVTGLPDKGFAEFIQVYRCSLCGNQLEPLKALPEWNAEDILGIIDPSSAISVKALKLQIVSLRHATCIHNSNSLQIFFSCVSLSRKGFTKRHRSSKRTRGKWAGCCLIRLSLRRWREMTERGVRCFRQANPQGSPGQPSINNMPQHATTLGHNLFNANLCNRI